MQWRLMLGAGVLAIPVLLSCLGAPAPQTDCDDVSGQWSATYSACGGSGQGQLAIEQHGCDFQAALPGQGFMTGTVLQHALTFSIKFFPCVGSADGTATFENGGVKGSYAGAAHGPMCCNPANGAFVLSR